MKHIQPSRHVVQHLLRSSCPLESDAAAGYNTDETDTVENSDCLIWDGSVAVRFLWT